MFLTSAEKPVLFLEVDIWNGSKLKLSKELLLTNMSYWCLKHCFDDFLLSSSWKLKFVLHCVFFLAVILNTLCTLFFHICPRETRVWESSSVLFFSPLSQAQVYFCQMKLSWQFMLLSMDEVDRPFLFV